MLFCIITAISFSLPLVACKVKKEETLIQEKFVYDFDVKLTEKQAKINVKLGVVQTQSGASRTFAFYPVKDHQISNSAEKKGNIAVNKVTANGKDVEYEFDTKNFTVKVFEEHQKGDNTSYEFEYVINLVSNNSTLSFSDGQYLLYRFYPIPFDGEKCVFRFGQDNLTYPIFDFTAKVNLPKSWIALFTGELLEDKREDLTHTVTVKGEGIRDFSVIASNAFVARSLVADTPIYYYFKSDKKYQSVLNTAENAVNVFSEIFGESPFKELTVVKTAMDIDFLSLSKVVWIKDGLTEKETLDALIKGIAGEWWKYKIDVKENYLSESLIGFSNMAYYLRSDDGKTFKQKVDENKAYLEKLVVSGKQYALDIPLENAESGYLSTVGSLMWYDLYSLYGTELFDKLKTFANNYAGKTIGIDALFTAFDNDPKYLSVIRAWVDGSVILSF